jgi:adenylate kinase
MNIVLIGAQGSGKGTQAQLIKQKYGLNHVSTGYLIRQGIEQGDPTALKIKEGIEKGKLAPDEQVIELVKRNLSDKGNIFDGFPRTLPQAEALDEIAQIDLVIELSMPDELAIKRLSARRQCQDCRRIYGAENLPRKQDICDNCKGKLIQREDDKPEAIKKRLETYHEETEPLLEYYRPRKIVNSVDASKSIETVFKEICKIIDEIAGE